MILYMLLMPLGFFVFSARRQLTYLHLFQQEEYDTRRFLTWLWRERAFDKRLSLVLLTLLTVMMVPLIWPVEGRLRIIWFLVFFFTPALVGCACLIAACLEHDPRKVAKKPLAMTARAKRIYITALAFVAVTVSIVSAITWFDATLPRDAERWRLLWTFHVLRIVFGQFGSWEAWVIIWVQLVPLTLVAANLLLAPFEARVQRRYWREAHEKLLRLDPIVIGITGSYGKTSVKHILGHVLETAAPTLITPGSVNTAMGIARVIRERLQPHHRYFVVEMGAYGIGSIRRLCALTPPKLGIISAIGKAHYERFKSLDAVSHAKFELAEAARDNCGAVVIAADTLEFAWPREFAERHRDIVIIVGDDAAGTDLAVEELRQEKSGILAAVSWRGARYELRAPLYGLHQGRNTALAFAAACHLGLEPEDVVASLASVPQIAHRLEVKRQGDGAVVIDDAYNSNPVGFASALALLDELQQPGGRRILVTPGMVELGSEHEAEHSRIGRLAAEHADILVAVAPHRVAPLAAAFAQAAPQRDIVPCATFAEARAWLDRNLAGHDVVLLENDLPDLLEQKPRL